MKNLIQFFNDGQIFIVITRFMNNVLIQETKWKTFGD